MTQYSVPVILVGGYGFIGRNIIAALRGDASFADLVPMVIDNLSNSAPGHDSLGLRNHIGSYQDSGAVDFIRAQGEEKAARIFVFLAGETRVAESRDRPMDFIAANIVSPSRFVLDAVQSGDHFILVSTAGALFDGSRPVSVDSPVCPKNFYGATKAAEELLLEQLVNLRGAQFSVVRLTNVFGPHSDNKKSAVHAFIRASLDNVSVTVNGDGGQSRDFVYAGDVGRGIATLAQRLRQGQKVPKVCMLGSGTSTTLMDVVHAVGRVAGQPLKYTHIPATDLLATEPRDVIADANDVRVLLGDTITSFDAGLAQTMTYYQVHNPS